MYDAVAPSPPEKAALPRTMRFSCRNDPVRASGATSV